MRALYLVLAASTMSAALFVGHSVAQPRGPDDCTTLLDCAKVAAKAAAEAKAALTAFRQPAVIRSVPTAAVGSVHQNTSGRTRIVTVSAERPGEGQTMIAHVSLTTAALPVSQVTSGAFIRKDHATSLTFVVPNMYFYQITTDSKAQDVRIVLWSEADI